MGALGRLNIQQWAYGFNDGTDTADIRPTNRNTQPSVRRTPTPWSQQQVLAILVQHFAVEPTQLSCHINSESRIKGIRLNVHDVGDFTDFAVSEGLCGKKTAKLAR